MLGEQREDGLYIEGLKYEFPPRPPLKEIRNYGLPKNKQVWSRRKDDEQFDWSDGWEERLNDNPEQVQFIVDEIDRLNNGEWVYIGGEATYINNFCYFFLSHFILEDSGEYPEYRDTSLYYYRFVEICDKMRLCTGHTLMKGRRLGATSMVMARMLLKALLTRNKSFGITSKTGVDAETAFGFLVIAFQALKPYLKPQMEGNESPKKVLSLKKQANRIKKDQKVSNSNREGLNNKVLWRSTSSNTFDGGAYEEILVDESGKFPSDVPIDKYLAVVTKCVKKGAKVTGKLCLPTTVNPPKDGGAAYRIVYDNSDQSKADYLGQTKTGLNRIMIPAYLGFAGYMDMFGNSVWQTPTEEQRAYLESTGECPDPNIGSKAYLEHIRKQLESDNEALQEEIRMNPFNAIEVFETSNNRCLFDVKNLNDREAELIDRLEEQGKNPYKDELGRRGWFQKSPSGRVHFVDDKEGLWYVDNLISEEESNRHTLSYKGEQIPTNEELGCGGLDSIASGDATVDAGSDACLIIRNRYSSMNPERTGIPMAMLLGRMADVNKFHQQVYNGLQYYGVKMLAERAPISWLTYAVDNKLTGYLYGTQRSDGTWVYGVVAQQSAATKDEHAEVQVLSSLHDYDKIPFIRLVRDRKAFSVNDRTDFDACMADGYCLMAMRIPFKKVVKENKKRVFLQKGRILN